MIRVIWVALAAFLVAIALPSTARATSLYDMTIEQLTDASSYIVRGEVIGASWSTLDDRGLVWTHTRVRVDETLKGKVAPDEVVVTTSGGTYGAITQYVAAESTFSDGEKVLLFLHEGPSGRLYPVGKFLGKFTVRRAPGDTRSYAMNWHASEGDVYDHRFLPHEDASRRVYVDDMVRRIQDRLDVGWDGKPIPGISNAKLAEINGLEWRTPR